MSCINGSTYSNHLLIINHCTSSIQHATIESILNKEFNFFTHSPWIKIFSLRVAFKAKRRKLFYMLIVPPQEVRLDSCLAWILQKRTWRQQWQHAGDVATTVLVLPAQNLLWRPCWIGNTFCRFSVPVFELT